MTLVVLLLLVAALVCFLIATFGVFAGRISVGWLGLAFAAIAEILARWPGQ